MDNLYYLVVSMGYWGGGKTLKEAKENHRKAGGNLRGLHFVHSFKSDLPFAPPSREATEQEADAYITNQGGMCYVRCELIETKEVK